MTRRLRPLFALLLTALAVVADAQSFVVPNILIRDDQTGYWLVAGGPELPTGGASRITDGARFLHYGHGWVEWDGTRWAGPQSLTPTPLTKGDAGFMFSDEDTLAIHGKTIANTDAVLVYMQTANSAATPAVWTLNPLVIKMAADPASYVIAIEASLSNNTAEADETVGTGAAVGVLSSYTHTANNGTAAFMSTALAPVTSNGWKNGLWIDGVTTTGRGIVLEDGQSSNGGMKRGLDTTGVASFADGAIVLGSGAKGRIRWLNADGSNGAQMLSSSDVLIWRSPATETMSWQNAAGNVTAMQLGTGAVASDSTALLLLTDHGDVEALRQVVVGAADSCGAGFRCLRVAN